MSIPTNLPQIKELQSEVELIFGKKLNVHNDFVLLADSIHKKLHEFISETTLERVWQYSTRGYATVSRRTLDVLCEYSGFDNWSQFCETMKLKSGKESDFFDEESILTKYLNPGDRIRIGWRPDRICIIRYLGDNRFIAEECWNATMQPGDTFSCIQFQLYRPLYLENFESSKGRIIGKRYVAGSVNGITICQLLAD